MNKIVIVGGGHAAAQLCGALAEAGLGSRVHLVCAEESLPYQRPPLSKAFLKSPTEALQLQRAESWYAQAGITVHLADPVLAIDRAARQLRLQSGQLLDYEQLVLATGARARRLAQLPTTLANVAVLRGAADAAALRDQLGQVQSLVVLGAGFIGLEVAATARALGLAEDPNPPMTHIFLRGNVRTLGAEVQPGTLSMLHPAPKDAPPNRLGLAQWLASRENPLTARVMVNRWWAELFGQGLVTTPEDFGLQGDFPSHPELLDWLAVEFMDSGWSMKRLVKFVVTSATYQQSSKSTAASLARDPQNRLLTRGPRHRLDAELVRDNALAIAGLLHHEIGGPPVAATRADARKAQEVFSWRRGIYVRQQRGEPYATFSSFDAPDRFACSARRSRTNTPLQALAVLNEPTFFEAATRLAERTTNLQDFNERLVFMFKLCLARSPQPSETAMLLDLFEKTKRAGASEPDTWRLIANVLLNLDETITKE